MKKNELVEKVAEGASLTKADAERAISPQTGQEIQIPASKVPAFKASSTLKDAVNK